MTKEDVIAKVKSLNFSHGSYVVYGAALFAVYGVREVRDIDMFVSPELYEQLKKRGWKKIMKGPRDEPLIYDVFEAHNTWEFSPYAPTFEELMYRSVTYTDVTLASIEDICKWKEASGRPKDLADLKLIDAYLKVKSMLKKTTT